MNINGLNLTNLLPPLSPSTSGAQVGTSSNSFGSAVRNAVESLEDSQKVSEQEVAKAVGGETQDLHRTIIAMQTADLGFQFALQVRNKLVNAYEEIMRIQV